MTSSNLTAGGITFPKLGLGTFQLAGKTCQQAVESAIAIGYRHIDTAQMYGNEAEVGAGILQSGLSRSEIHLTTKVWHENLSPAGIERSLSQSLLRLATPYVDLLLVHWPSPTMKLDQVIATLLALREQGLIKALGVSNFPVALLRQAVEDLKAPIACNQVEYHALLSQTKLLSYARSVGVPLVAYSPLARGQLADDPVLKRIAKKHGASAAQVGLKWLLDQEGVGGVPKATQAASQKSNFEALGLVLDAEDIRAIDALPKDRRLVDPGFGPVWD
jgi:2,5-diketo-D-gluconate reductase B